jgi:hypothetical protein
MGGPPQRETIASDFFLRDPWDVRTYPAPRAKRSGPPPGSTGGPLTSAPGQLVGRTRLFPFRLAEGAGTRNTISTPRLQGNVVVHSFFYAIGAAADPPNDTIEIGYAPAPVTEINVALTVARPYTVLTELIDHNNGIANDRGAGFPNYTGNVPQRGTRIPLGLIILERELAVTVSVVNPSGFVQNYDGYFNLTENLSYEALAGYIPSP